MGPPLGPVRPGLGLFPFLLLVVVAAAQGARDPQGQREATPAPLRSDQSEVGFAGPPAPPTPGPGVPDFPPPRWDPPDPLLDGQRQVEFPGRPQEMLQEDVPLQREVETPQKLEDPPLQKEQEPKPLPLGQKEASQRRGGGAPELNQKHNEETLPPFLIHGWPARQQAGGSSSSSPARCPQGAPAGGWSSRLDGFPPGRPTQANLERICLPARQRVTYGPWNLPQTGFSHLSRQGQALNRLETGYGACCLRQHRGARLDCAQLVWAEALGQFCEAEFSIKTKPHRCCPERGPSRLACFEAAAPRPDYRPRPPCPRPDAPAARGAPAFPPGEPTPGNVENICRLRRFRSPVPVPGEEPGEPRELGPLRRQARALGRLEAEFKRCCGGGRGNVTCARRAWEETLDDYCGQEQAVKTRHHPCCHDNPGPARDDCFARRAPYPDYDRELLTLDLSRVTPELMSQICGYRQVLTKHKQIPGLIHNMTAVCCNLPPDNQSQCAEEEKSAFITNLCGPRRGSWRDPESCCDRQPGRSQNSCFNNHYLNQVALVAGEPGQPPEPEDPRAPGDAQDPRDPEAEAEFPEEEEKQAD